MRRVGWGFVVLAFIAVAGWYQFNDRSRQLRFVPPAMGVSTILYAQEESWGFGPGGNETGIIVYDMPENTRERIQNEGKDWLNSLPGNGGKRLRGFYRNWHSTPFDPNIDGAFDIWAMKKRAESCDHGGGIAGYMFRFSTCIRFDQHYESMANEALLTSGNFYAFGRIGMLLLIPSQDLVIFAYSG